MSGCTTNKNETIDTTQYWTGPDNVIAFIGKKVWLKEFNPSKNTSNTDEDELSIYADTAFKARYKVIQVVNGQYSGEYIDFKVYDHSGDPKFVKHDTVMLYVGEFDGELVQFQYQFDVVHPTSDAGYAGCSNPYLNASREMGLAPQSLHPIQFKPAVVKEISRYLIPDEMKEEYNPAEIERNRTQVAEWFSYPVFKVNEDKAQCQMGVYPNEIFSLWKKTYLLPLQRERLCEEKVGSDLGQLGAIESCVSDMAKMDNETNDGVL